MALAAIKEREGQIKKLVLLLEIDQQTYAPGIYTFAKIRSNSRITHDVHERGEIIAFHDHPWIG